MIHHKVHIFLCKGVKASVSAILPFENTSDQLVVHFDCAFLIRASCVTVENSGTDYPCLLVTFDGNRIGELASIVCQNNRKQFLEQSIAQGLIEMVEDIDYGLCRVGFPQISKHQSAGDKVNRQETFAAHRTDNRIHLNDRGIRMLLEEELKILVVTADAAAFIHLELFLLFPRTQTFLPRKVGIADIKEAGVHVGIERFLTAHDLFPVVDIDLVKGLPLTDQGRNQVVKTL